MRGKGYKLLAQNDKEFEERFMKNGGVKLKD